jgi:hypothetical protein
MAGKIDASQVPPDVMKRALAQQGRARPRKPRSMDMHAVRSYAIRCLNTMADLTQAERTRVLKHATKVNDV